MPPSVGSRTNHLLPYLRQSTQSKSRCIASGISMVGMPMPPQCCCETDYSRPSSGRLRHHRRHAVRIRHQLHERLDRVRPIPRLLPPSRLHPTRRYHCLHVGRIASRSSGRRFPGRQARTSWGPASCLRRVRRGCCIASLCSERGSPHRRTRHKRPVDWCY